MPGLKKLSFYIENAFHTQKRILWEKNKAPAASGPA